MTKEKILGVDPGTQITGWGLIELSGNQYKLIEFGAIKTKAKDSLPEKYLSIFEGIETILKLYKPDALSVETQYVHKNVQSALKLSMARGSVLIASAKNKVPVFEYTPSKAKQAVTGNGSASKMQIGRMMQLLLHLKELPSPEDAADALALAITHAHFSKVRPCMNI